jgi:mRNA interferase MazF
MVKNLSFGDIVLLNFPFTDEQTFKRRSALVIQDCNDGDIIVCRITSKIYDSDKDVFIDNWKKSGLKLPSVIRVHKIATLEKGMVELILGKIDKSLKEKVKNIIAKLTE